jgi:PHP domain/Carbohydrate binding domain (family 11)
VRHRGVLALGLVLVAAASVLSFLVARSQPLPVVGSPPSDGYVRVPGVVHVHTSLSDGGGTPDEVIRAARAAGLRFVVITDHNNLDAKAFEGYRDGVLVLVGTEVSTTVGHVLGLGIPDPVFRFSGDGRDALDDIDHLGGFAFAAHPSSPRADLAFTGWDLPGSWGLELLNGDTEWRRAGARLLWTFLLYRLNPRYALLQSLSPPDATLSRWDELLARRDVPGIAAADAHSRVPLTRKRSLRWPSYESLFALSQDVLLLDRPLSGSASDDASAVLGALRRGRLYLGLTGLAAADGFSFVAEAAGKRYTMGETASLVPGIVLKAGGRMPRGTEVVLRRNGQVLSKATETLEAPVPGPGVYRVEARIPGQPVPWVLTNPIYVFDDSGRELRTNSAKPPSAPVAPRPAQMVDDFEAKTGFETGVDTKSTVRADMIDPTGGVGGTRAARLEFRLGLPEPDHPHVFAALVDRTSRDFAGRTGLVFSIRADGEYRIWVQVRDENPASKDEGTEWWFASVRTSREWQRIALPFSRLRSINPATDGRLDLDKVRAIVFVLDKGSDKPGTAGTIWLDDVGVY